MTSRPSYWNPSPASNAGECLGVCAFGDLGATTIPRPLRPHISHGTVLGYALAWVGPHSRSIPPCTKRGVSHTRKHGESKTHKATKHTFVRVRVCVLHDWLVGVCGEGRAGPSCSMSARIIWYTSFSRSGDASRRAVVASKCLT